MTYRHGPNRLLHDNSPDHTKFALRTSLQCRVQGASTDDDVRQSLRQVCVNVRASGATASDLIIMLKQVWASLPEILHQPSNRAHEEVRSRVVSMAIAEYYRPGADLTSSAGALRGSEVSQTI